MSRPLVSIIVPTCNSAGYLEGCLRSIVRQDYERVELIVVDNNSRDNTKEIAARYTDHVYNRGPERSAQRNFGVQQSRGEYVLMIDSDMELSREVVKSCVDAIPAHPSVKAIIIPEESFGKGFWAKCKKLERSFYHGLDWQEAARFFDRQIYDACGGYDEELTGSEDYDFPNRIEQAHGKESIGRVAPLIYHNEQQLRLMRVLRKKFYYGTTLGGYVRKDANKERLARQTSLLWRYGVFLSRPFELCRHPLVGAGMLFMKTCEFAAGWVGYLWGKMLHLKILNVVNRKGS